MSPDLVELVEAAESYLNATDAVDNDPEIEDNDPRWEVFFLASARFERALGYGFAADPREVAGTVMRFAENET